MAEFRDLGTAITASAALIGGNVAAETAPKMSPGRSRCEACMHVTFEGGSSVEAD